MDSCLNLLYFRKDSARGEDMKVVVKDRAVALWWDSILYRTFFFYSLSMLQVVTISSEERSSAHVSSTLTGKKRNPWGSHSSHIGRPDLGWPSDLSSGVKRIGLISAAEGLNEGGRAAAVAGGMLCERAWGLLNNPLCLPLGTAIESDVLVSTQRVEMSCG